MSMSNSTPSVARAELARIVALIACLLSPGFTSALADEDVRILGSWSGVPICEKIGEALMASQGPTTQPVRCIVSGAAKKQALSQFLRGQCDVLVVSGQFTAEERKAVGALFEDDAHLARSEFLLGRFAVGISVNQGSSVRRLSYEQIRDIVAGREKCATVGGIW